MRRRVRVLSSSSSSSPSPLSSDGEDCVVVECDVKPPPLIAISSEGEEMQCINISSSSSEDVVKSEREHPTSTSTSIPSFECVSIPSSGENEISPTPSTSYASNLNSSPLSSHDRTAPSFDCIKIFGNSILSKREEKEDCLPLPLSVFDYESIQLSSENEVVEIPSSPCDESLPILIPDNPPADSECVVVMSGLSSDEEEETPLR